MHRNKRSITSFDMRRGFWTTYVYRTVLLLIVACPFVLFVLGRDWEASAYVLLFAMCVVMVYGIGTGPGRIVSRRKLDALVERAIGHKTNDLYRALPASKLSTTGSGGWTKAAQLVRHDNTYYLSRHQVLGELPPPHNAVLVVRDNNGEFHLFRFGDGDAVNLPSPPADTIYVTAEDHGVVGPAAFARPKKTT